MLTVSLSTLCDRDTVAGRGAPVRVQIRVGTVVAAVTLAPDLALKTLDQAVFLLQFFG